MTEFSCIFGPSTSTFRNSGNPDEGGWVERINHISLFPDFVMDRGLRNSPAKTCSLESEGGGEEPG